MASLYVEDQLIATNELHGVLGNSLVNEEMVITYTHKKNKYYSIIIYDDEKIHSMIINIRGDNFLTGEIIVEFEPFDIKKNNYNAIIYIYEQPSKMPLPNDDFDMLDYAKENNLTLLYTIDFTVMHQLKYNKRKTKK